MIIGSRCMASSRLLPSAAADGRADGRDWAAGTLGATECRFNDREQGVRRKRLLEHRCSVRADCLPFAAHEVAVRCCQYRRYRRGGWVGAQLLEECPSCIRPVDVEIEDQKV